MTAQIQQVAEAANGSVFVLNGELGEAVRISGWQIAKRLLADAGRPDKPGLYVSRSCGYFWATVPYLARDQKRVEDVDSSGPDHAADALRYGVLRHSEARELNICIDF